jgi:hypothetical protein
MNNVMKTFLLNSNEKLQAASRTSATGISASAKALLAAKDK